MLGDIYEGMRLRYVIEEEPLGTAGPVRLALDEGYLEERFLVLNGDVLTDMDLSAELDAARAHRGAGHAGARSPWTTCRATAWCPPTTTGGSRPSSRRPRARCRPTASTPAPTSSSAT